MPFRTTPQQILGEFDSDWSPTIDVEFLINTQSSTLRCHIDTGSMFSVVFTDFDMADALQIRFRRGPRDPRVQCHLADGTVRYFVEGRATLPWFSNAAATVLAPDPLAPIPVGAAASTLGSTKPHPRILIGVPLLLGCRLDLNFQSNPGSVRLTGPPAGYVHPIPI
jgi:hypothetical protein